MQKVEMSFELTEGEASRIAATAQSVGLTVDQIYLVALVEGFKALGIDLGNTDPLSLIADDL